MFKHLSAFPHHNHGKNRASNETSSEQHFGCVDINNDRCDNIGHATDLDRVARFAKKKVQTSISYKGSQIAEPLHCDLKQQKESLNSLWTKVHKQTSVLRGETLKQPT